MLNDFCEQMCAFEWINTDRVCLFVCVRVFILNAIVHLGKKKKQKHEHKKKKTFEFYQKLAHHKC